jgi:hypothetical protein
MIAVTNNGKGIKVKILGNDKEDFQFNDKPICMHVFKRAFKAKA